MSHILKSHATPLHLYHAAYPFQTVYGWVCPFYVPASPNLLMSFRLMRDYVASLSTYETFLPSAWASRYKRLGLGLRLLALATKATSDIQFTATTWFVFVPQGNFLTCGLWPKHDLPWYRKTIILHTIRNTNMICFGSTNPLSNILSTAQAWFA